VVDSTFRARDSRKPYRWQRAHISYWFYERHTINKQAITRDPIDEYLRTFSGREGVLGNLEFIALRFRASSTPNR
jgi:hypothetical protein